MMQEGFETRKIFHDQSLSHSLSDLWTKFGNRGGIIAKVII